MPRTSRKRNNRRNESTVRVTSNLSANAPEFIPIANDEATANQREGLVIQSMTFCGSSSASNSSGSNSNSNYAATTIISSIPDALKNKGQRDLLINLLNENKVDCVICYERVKNIEQTWNCRNCYQIMHLKCITVWFIKSHGNAIWRCPACQSEVTGKPKYVCYCGTLPNPYFNNVDIPHSCGQVCGLPRKNYNLNYDDCHHKCTLLCHPGPCPQCVVQVIRSCGCGKKQEYALCGQATQIVCNSICLKKLNCQIHECQKVCHAKGCGPCDKGCPQYRTRTPAAALALLQSSASFAEAIIEYNRLPPDSEVTEEELRALGLTPEELYEPRSSVYDSYYSTSNESDVDDDDFDVEVNVDDIDEIMQDIDFGYRNNSNFPVVLANPLSGYSGSHEFEIEYPVTDDDDDDNDDDEEEEDDVDADADADADADDTGEEENDENNENNEGCVLNNYDSRDNGTTNDSWDWADSSSEEEREIVNTSSPMDSEGSGDNSWDMSDDSSGEEGVIAGTNSSYSEDSTTDSSQSSISYINDSNSSASNHSSGSDSGSSSSSSSSF